MCGRFILLTDLAVLTESFGIQEIAAEYTPGGNICPGRFIAAVVQDEKKRLVAFRWGLIPAWANDPAIGHRMFNARAETVAEKPSFKHAFQKRRCLIPADGFYEWQKLETGKRSLCFSLKSGRPFGLAGIYETWISPEKESIRTCTIITTESNDLIRPTHDRMPVIMPKGKEKEWLEPHNDDLHVLSSLLKPYPSNEMASSEVGADMFSRPGKENNRPRSIADRGFD
jgi:putative SOS response-associated peptidase YedK